VTETVPFQWSSLYLQRGFAQDEIRVRRWAIDEDTAFGEVDVAVGPDGPHPFHLSAITSHRIVAQLAIDMICARTGMSKPQIGEVFEIEHQTRYLRKVVDAREINIQVRAIGHRRLKSLFCTRFSYGVGNGAFEGEIELGFVLRVPKQRGRLIAESSVDAYRDFYFSVYGSDEHSARTSKDVYFPKACIRFEPDPQLSEELRQLAADVGDCIELLHQNYRDDSTEQGSIAHRVPRDRRPDLPSLVRLDVVEGPEGCRVVEVNSGNCGGVETYSRMHLFLQKQRRLPGSGLPLLLVRFAEALDLCRRSAVEFVFIDDQSRYLSRARATLFAKAVPGLKCTLTPLREFLSRAPTDFDNTLIYRDFLYEELAELGTLGVAAETFFLSLPQEAYFPSLADEYLSDKGWIAAIDEQVRRGAHPIIRDSLAQKWMARMQPSVPLTANALPDALPFERPIGIVVKPSDGFGGHGVTLLERGRLPSSPSFYGGHASWVAQPLAETPRYPVERSGRGLENLRLVHGVFLLREGRKLSYAGTFSRLSPSRVVNIKNDGDVVYFVESKVGPP
jgi:hypothetical protein